MSGGGNAYSPEWFRVFLDPFPPGKTGVQVEFLSRQLPLPTHKRILDVCSGPGRIAGPLAALGYEVTAVDRDARAIQEGRAAQPGVTFAQGDMRDLSGVGGRFGGVICLWQSFGYFDEETNRRVLKDMASLLVAGGKLILDLYDRRYLEAHQGSESRVIQGKTVRTSREMAGNRLRVRIDYGDGGLDTFDWELFTPREIAELGVEAGLAASLIASDFNERVPSGETKPSFQIVFVRGG